MSVEMMALAELMSARWDEEVVRFEEGERLTEVSGFDVRAAGEEVLLQHVLIGTVGERSHRQLLCWTRCMSIFL